MGGKASILLVLGFSTIFLFLANNFNRISTDSVENNADYYINSKAHFIAVSGANLALNSIFLDSDWRAGYSNLSFQEGSINVTLTDSTDDILIIRSTSTYMGEMQRVKIKMQPSGFAKFAWYIGNMSSKEFITGDTVYGPFHSQSQLNIAGDPVFWGKTTTLKGLSPNEKQLKKNGYDPKFYGGYDSGVDIPLPSNTSFSTQQATAKDDVDNNGGSNYFENSDLWLTLNDNGTVTYRTGSGSDSTTYDPPVTLPLATFAPSGLLYVEKGNIYLSGTLNGKLTIVAGESSGIGHGNVYLADDIKYTEDPMLWDAGKNTYVSNTDCTDMLGLIATNNVVVMDNAKNVNNKDIEVHASIFCAKGGLILEDPNIPPSGSFTLRGGLIAGKEETIAIIDNIGMIKNGYKRHVVFDERFYLQSPAHFPKTGNFEILSWLE